MTAGTLSAAGRDRSGHGPVITVALLAVAATGWWWSARMADDMAPAGEMPSSGMGGMGGMEMGSSLSLGAFVVAWVAMMAAMMLPAVLPVVRLYARAAERGRAAPVPFFVAGYLGVWSAAGLPAYLAWRALDEPLAAGEAWTGRVAAAALAAAAVWQLTPVKHACLRHCRSPLGFFLRARWALRGRLGALRAGATHGLLCMGCCWALFAVLVALGTMNLAWMAVVTVFVVLEKHAPGGRRIATAGGVACAGLAAVLLADPSTIAHIT
ncbi:MAG TPA: DUF2182 domain-containing protein [Baekduia sp.]|nr:DUF2182 domain-containing protein [Baekduia sp.]